MFQISINNIFTLLKCTPHIRKERDSYCSNEAFLQLGVDKSFEFFHCRETWEKFSFDNNFNILSLFQEQGAFADSRRH
jgi:hypothetical protein